MSTIKFEAKLEHASSGLNLFSENIDHEYLLKLSSKVDYETFPWLKRVKDEEVNFIFILDNSGSMRDRPWNRFKML
uniref:VWA domain-containing protein n=1 Tax=viral metagenome TaxID=1070528 RepID=A0A6C0JE23_9ZZZZ